MKKDIKEQLSNLMDLKGIKIPAISKATGIPADRIRAWYRDNTQPKAEDQEKLKNFIKTQTPAGNGGGDSEESSKYVSLLESHIETLQKSIAVNLEQLATSVRLLQAQQKTTLQELAKIQAKGNAAAEEKVLGEINKRLAENYTALSKTGIAGNN